MKLEDITKEQAFEIVRLMHDNISSGMDFKYYPYDESMYEDAKEFVLVTFKGIVFADKVYDMRVNILPSLDCFLEYVDNNKCYTLPTRNQYQIQKNFVEWGFKPQ
jgi:hypothetical protein